MRTTIAVLLLSIPVAALADRQTAVVGDVTFEVEALRPLTVTRDDGGLTIEATAMPRIRIEGGERCDEEAPQGWRSYCIEGDRGALRALVEIEGDEQARSHVEQLLGSLTKSVRPPIEVVPQVVIDRTEFAKLVRRGSKPGEVIVDGVTLEVSLEVARCPTDGTFCRELADRAVVIRGGSGATANRVRDKIAESAEREYGKGTWLTGNVAREWAGGELELRQLPKGDWRLSERDRALRLHEVRGADITISPRACSELWASPPAGDRVERPRFVPASAAIVDARDGWRATACVRVNGVDLVVAFALPAPPDDATERALNASFTEPSRKLRTWVTIAGMTNGRVGGFSIEGWVVDRFSIAGGVEFLGIESNDGPREARLAIAGGLGYSRPRMRAGIHLGFAFEHPPTRTRTGEDADGGALFFDARALRELRPFAIIGLVRGSYFFDIDCSSQPHQDGCGDSDDSDFGPRFGIDSEVRVGLSKTVDRAVVLDGFVGLRYVAVWTADLRDDTLLVTFGGSSWW